MRTFVQAITDPRARAEFDRILQRVQRQMGPTAASPERIAQQGGPGVPQSLVAAPPLPPAPPETPQPDVAMMDPSEAYTEEVKVSLIDAMIENSGTLVIGGDEWLTVAARDNAPSDPFMPGGQDAMTLVIRVKGEDLNAFRAGRLSLEQVRARVEVGEF
jgi:hypothetical protein